MSLTSSNASTAQMKRNSFECQRVVALMVKQVTLTLKVICGSLDAQPVHVPL